MERMGKLPEESRKKAGLPEKEDLGTYTAESGEILAELNLSANISYGLLEAYSPGNRREEYLESHELYIVHARFSSTGFSAGGFGMNESNIEINYDSHNLNEILLRLTKSAEGVAELLSGSRYYRGNQRDSSVTRNNVMRCIFSLEDQIQNLSEERANLKSERSHALKN